MSIAHIDALLRMGYASALQVVDGAFEQYRLSALVYPRKVSVGR